MNETTWYFSDIVIIVLLSDFSCFLKTLIYFCAFVVLICFTFFKVCYTFFIASIVSFHKSHLIEVLHCVDS